MTVSRSSGELDLDVVLNLHFVSNEPWSLIEKHLLGDSPKLDPSRE